MPHVTAPSHSPDGRWTVGLARAWGNRPTLTQHARHRPASGVVHDPARLSNPLFVTLFLPLLLAHHHRFTHALAVGSFRCRVAASTALRPLSISVGLTLLSSSSAMPFPASPPPTSSPPYTVASTAHIQSSVIHTFSICSGGFMRQTLLFPVMACSLPYLCSLPLRALREPSWLFSSSNHKHVAIQ